MAADGGTSIKAVFQGLMTDNIEVIQGVVTSADPLKIQMANDEKLIVGPGNVYVPRHLTDYETTVDISGGSVDGSTDSSGTHSHTIKSISIKGATMKVYNALKAGESVHLLSFRHGKQYYVLDRVD